MFNSRPRGIIPLSPRPSPGKTLPSPGKLFPSPGKPISSPRGSISIPSSFFWPRNFQSKVVLLLLLILLAVSLSAIWQHRGLPSRGDLLERIIPLENRKANVLPRHLHQRNEASDQDGGNEPASAVTPFLLHIHLLATCDQEAIATCFQSLKSADYQGDRVKLSIIASCPDDAEQLQLARSLELLDWPSGKEIRFVEDQGIFSALKTWRPSRLEHAFVVKEGCQVSPLYHWYLKQAATTYLASEDDNSPSLFGIALHDAGGSAEGSVSRLRQVVAEDCQLLFPTPWRVFSDWSISVEPASSSLGVTRALYDFFSKCRHDHRATFLTLMRERGYYNLFPEPLLGSTRLCLPGQQKVESGPVKVPELELLLSNANGGGDEALVLEPQPLENADVADLCGRPVKHGQLARNKEQLQEILSYVQEKMSIVMVMASPGFDDMLANWLCFIKELDVQNYLIVTPSIEQATRLARQGHSAYFLASPGERLLNTSSFASSNSSSSALGESMDYGSIAYKQFILERTQLVRLILQLGYHTLLADVDAVWLANPFPYMANPGIDIHAQLEASGVLCGGFLFLRSTAAVRQLWNKVTDKYAKVVKRMMEEQPLQKAADMPAWLKSFEHLHEQRYLNQLVKEQQPPVQVKGLNAQLFPNGQDYFDRHKPQAAGIWPVVIHNNYIKGKLNKTQRFERSGLWRVGPDGQTCMCLSCDSWQHGKSFGM